MVPGAFSTEAGPIVTPSLRIRRDGTPERLVEVRGECLIVGRADDCDVVLGAPTVSCRHARLTRGVDGLVHLEDLSSRNNTYLDGRPIRGRGVLQLHDGQVIRICDFWLIFNGEQIRVEDRTPSSAWIRASVEVASSEETPAPSSPAAALRGVLEVSRAVGSTLELDEVLDKVLDALFLVFPQADRGFVHLSDRVPIDRHLVPRRQRIRRPWSAEPYAISRTVLEEVFVRSMALCCEDVRNDERLAVSESIVLSGIRTMICAPILDRTHRPIGILQLDSRNGRAAFGPDDLELLRAMLGPIGVAVENARLHEEIFRRRQRDHDAENAREVQRALLPEEPPRPPGYDFWHYYEPAHEVGGDYFGYFQWPPCPSEREGTRWTIALGDVAGKGMPAALLMAKLSAEVQLALSVESDPERVMARLNRRIREAELPDSFITFAILTLDTERHRASIVGAGHQSPLIRRADGRVANIPGVPQGPPLGVLDEIAPRSIEVSIAPGDAVVLYTDGAPDAVAPDGQILGTLGFRDLIGAGPAPASALGPSLIGRIAQFAGGAEQADDITLICFGRPPSPDPAVDGPPAP